MDFFFEKFDWQKCKPNKLNVLKLNSSVLPFAPGRRPGTLLVFNKTIEVIKPLSVEIWNSIIERSQDSGLSEFSQIGFFPSHKFLSFSLGLRSVKGLTP